MKIKTHIINISPDSAATATAAASAVITDAVTAITATNDVVIVEKKKRGRKRLIKPDPSITISIENVDTTNTVTASSDGSENVLISSEPDVVVHKKRGRKPKGGKIIQDHVIHNNNIQELPNIILHLKCVLSDLKSSNRLNSSDVDAANNVDEHDGENEIMCYNDQHACGSEVLNDNYSTDSSESPKCSDANKMRPSSSISDLLTTTTVKLTKATNSDNSEEPTQLTQPTQPHYDPSTFSNSVHTCEANDVSAQAQLFYDWKDKHQNDDTDAENTSIKEIWRKISQLKLNYHKGDAFQTIGMHRSACFWCTCDFDTPQIYIPKSMIKEVCNAYGCFCHPECAVAFLMNENIDTSTKFERYHLLNSLYGPIYNYEKSIKPAPNPYYLLNKYYGNLSIIEYRKLFKSEQLIYVVSKPLTHILPELYEDNNDFLVGNKIIQNNNIQLKKKVNKNVKTNIMNEVFGINK